MSTPQRGVEYCQLASAARKAHLPSHALAPKQRAHWGWRQAYAGQASLTGKVEGRRVGAVLVHQHVLLDEGQPELRKSGGGAQEGQCGWVVGVVPKSCWACVSQNWGSACKGRR